MPPTPLPAGRGREKGSPSLLSKRRPAGKECHVFLFPINSPPPPPPAALCILETKSQDSHRGELGVLAGTPLVAGPRAKRQPPRTWGTPPPPPEPSYQASVLAADPLHSSWGWEGKTPDPEGRLGKAPEASGKEVGGAEPSPVPLGPYSCSSIQKKKKISSYFQETLRLEGPTWMFPTAPLLLPQRNYYASGRKIFTHQGWDCQIRDQGSLQA